MKRALITFASALLLIASTPGTMSSATRKFYDDDPVSVVRDTQDASGVKPWDISLAYDAVTNLFHTNRTPASRRAQDVNTIDEVPDSSWFVNRPLMSPEQVAQGVNSDTGPAPGKWTVRSGKGNGVSPGFTVTDTKGTRYYVKFDPPDWNELATGAEVAVTRLYHALGYYVPQTNIAFLRREDLVLGDGATVTGTNGKKRAMHVSDIDDNLRRAYMGKDGRYRAMVSLQLEGKPLDGFKYAGTRPDDPNDVIPHEDMRSLRGARVFGAWVNHNDAKAINSLDMLITEGGRAYVRHNLLDFGSTLGSGGVEPAELFEGYEYLWEGHAARKALPALGLAPRRWMGISYPGYKSYGRFEAHDFIPEEWRPRIPAAAFLHARADDLFWGARRLMMAMPDDVIRAAMDAGRFTETKAAEPLAKILSERRDKIGRAWLTQINPIVDPAIAADGALAFKNAAVQYGFAPAPSGYKAVWSNFDNTTGATTPIGETAGTASGADGRAPAPSGISGDYVQVDISATGAKEASWSVPVHAWFRKSGGGWKLVGFERLP